MTQVPTPQCAGCKHLIEPWRCKAFPVWIPEAIRHGEHDHRKPYPGDNGIRFEPTESDEVAESEDSA